MAERTVAVITDSVCGLDPLVAAEYGVFLLPVRVNVGQRSMPDGVGITAEEAVAAIDAGEAVETHEPTVATFAEAFSQCARAGATAVVSVHVSGALSRTVEVAREAAAAAPVPVTVVDTGTTAMAQGFAALAAGAVSLAGGNAAEVAFVAQKVAASSRVYFTVDTLDYLRRSGRVSGTVAAFGSLLKVRPVMSVHDGEVQPIDRVRRTEAARRAVIERAEADARGMERPAAAVGLVGGDPGDAGLRIAVTGPTLVTSPPTSLAIHTGPGMFYAAVADMPVQFTDIAASAARR